MTGNRVAMRILEDATDEIQTGGLHNMRTLEKLPQVQSGNHSTSDASVRAKVASTELLYQNNPKLKVLRNSGFPFLSLDITLIQ